MGNLTIIAFASYAGCTLLRFLAERLNLVVSSGTKLLLATLVAAAVAAALLETAQDVATFGLAGAGAATVVHRVHRLIGALGDRLRLDVLQGSARRR